MLVVEWGGLLEKLTEYGQVYGMDCEEEAVKYCNSYWPGRVFRGSLPDDIPFSSEMFDIIVLSDCLEHIEEDYLSLSNLRNLMKSEGSFLLITVPAFMWLWSYNDEFVHHKRRYNKEQLIALVESAGYHVEMCSYYNFWLFPVVWLIRKIKNLCHIKKDDLQDVRTRGILNKVLEIVFASERWWLKRHSFPVGVSLILVASPIRKRIDESQKVKKG